MKNLWKSALAIASFSLLMSPMAFAKEAATPSPAPTAASAKVELIDLNSADKKELSTLPKIGDVRSDAIIKGRPYKGKDELLSKKILTEDVYNGIKDLVIAKQKPAAKK
ncbi:ComEA family DNA-binding protein [Undibacterium sp. SXout7W]|uniref:ComEA family DNA-binding protein n=1 Tax=Undibacterium sp. SXout7W TaxID=3413049 RepID=UPI003BF13AB6